jgi:hypothetical protein
MIPQRNISLLANRLYKEHGGRRIPEAVLERDYCLAWFLAGLSQSKLRNLLIFKGGTALKRCHFGDYRFSEDLDFTRARKVEFAEIREGNDVNQVSYGSSGDELFAPVFGCIGHAHGFSGLCFGGQPGRQPILRESKGSWMVRKAVVIWVAA